MKINQIYDHFVAGHFDEDPFEIMAETRKIALSQIQSGLSNKMAKIFDLGMGTGDLLSALGDLFPQASLSGMDSSKKMIEKAHEKLHTNVKRDIQIFHDDALLMGRYINEGALDLLTIHFLLNYVDYRKIFSEIHRALRQGGLCSVMTSTRKSYPVLHSLAGQFVSDEFIQSQFHVPEDLETLSRDLVEGGFKILKGELFEKKLCFKDFDDLYHFTFHSGWFSNSFFAKMSPEEIESYREIGRPFFPIEDKVQVAILLAKKT